MKLSDRILSFSTMLNMQNELNCIMRSPGWADNNSPDRLSIHNYQTQVLVEHIEMITESGVDFKWWKHCDINSFDRYNVNLEAIDILHFALSMHWLTTCDIDGSNDTSAYDQKFVGSDVSKLDNTPASEKMFNGNVLNQQIFVYVINAFMNYQNMIPESTREQQAELLHGVICHFFSALELDAPYISALYRAKYELNKFRMSDGYKNGTYVKVVDGLEDNQRLKPIVDAFVADQTKTLDWVASEVRKKFFQSNI